MVFEQDIMIKTVLACDTAGRSVIPALQTVVQVTMMQYLDFFSLPYSDFNPNIECPLVMKDGEMVRRPKSHFRTGLQAENQSYVAGLAYLLTVSAIANDGKLCLAYGGDLEYA